MIANTIATQLQLSNEQVQQTLLLLDEGATIPFISRYRKERTGNLDEVEVANIQQAAEKFRELEKRRDFILKTLDEQGNLSSELEGKVKEAGTLTALEDLYLPFKPKRLTRAEKARKLGLEPLAGWMMKQQHGNVEAQAQRYVKGDVADIAAALQGARDIMAEWMNERVSARNKLRYAFSRRAHISSKRVKGKDEEGKYRQYYEWDEALNRCPSHRLLAMRRGEAAGVLKVSIAPPTKDVLQDLERYFVKGNNECSAQVKLALKDAVKRLLLPSIETEFKNSSKIKADEEAIRVFAENLRQLLLAAPVGAKRTLAIDPGFRTGCKVVCLDAQGNLEHNATIYPHPPQKKADEARRKIQTLVDAYKIDVIAIGDGTAGRETEFLIKKCRFNRDLTVFVVNEDGASIYSASKVGREEFPSYDVTVRGAVSIGRRLMDPLAELVKIDAKSIGVGQYQHDVDQQLLQQSLDRTVESCVNAVGVNLNTASKHLLSYVAGIGPKLAASIVDFRAKEGAFQSREDLKKVPGLGAKTFEQCAGFLRLPNGKHPLDNSAVHPERYALTKRMAKDASSTLEELVGNTEQIEQLNLERYVTNEVGLLTIQDIIAELKKPGRDPRKKAKAFSFDESIRSIEDLKVGLQLPGLVKNITNFGAFIDIGLKQAGLVHLSEMAEKYVSDPNEVVRLHEQVQVKVMSVDADRGRIGLSMKGLN